jgi:lysyl-tRNA synthetase class I
MENISRNFYQDLTCARSKHHEAAKPVSVTSRTKAVVLSEIPNTTKHSGTRAAALVYEVICPNCARVEIASMYDLLKHRCNCGYGVFVEMLRSSPN